MSRERSLLDSIIASAAGLFFAGGMLLAPGSADASKGYKPPKGSGINRPPPGIVALYGVPAKPITKPVKPVKPPKYFPEYGVFVPKKPPKKQPPKYFPEYGVFVPAPPKKDPPRYFPEYGVFIPTPGK